MRSAASRMTVHCPLCDGQLVVRVLLPKPEHRDTKHPIVISAECSTRGCLVSEQDVHKLLGL
jgi:hypothetical protein